MVRIQIRLSKEVFAGARMVCEAKEISLSELAQCGIEHILTVYSVSAENDEGWQPPQPRHLGWRGLSDAGLKDAAQMTSGESMLKS